MNKRLLMDLSMFDGTDGSPAETGGIADHTSESQTDKKPQVLYGKQDAGNSEGDSRFANGTDSTDLNAEFDALIKDKYKEQYDSRIQDTINKRFKNQRDLSDELDNYNSKLSPLFNRYGIEAGDVDSLADAINNDDSLYKDEADERGISLEELKYMKQLEFQNQEAEMIRSRLEAEQKAQEDYDGWVAEAEALKTKYPNLDLRAEAQNEKFTGLLRMGWSVEDAYTAAHANEFIADAVGTAAKSTEKNVVDNIRARGMRPAENGIGQNNGVIIKDDPSKYSDADILEIIKRANAGEKIRL